MKKILTLVIITLTYTCHAQTGKIIGKIIDSKTGETLPGATVLIEGTTKGASADFDGNYSINGVSAGTHNLIVSYITYDTKKLTGIKVKENDVLDINITLDQSSSQNLGEVVVQAEMNKENTNTLLIMQKNNASLSDGVSSETIKKTPDRNTSDVLKRVSGASIQDNKFAIIRGLNDRYNAAYINGAPLPSSESDRKAFSFDIFPANLLDNLTINKTATPDMPGEFAGGIIFINTKSIPEKNFHSLNIGGGYNTITTGKTQLYYKGGKTDWLGIDDGTRALSAEIPNNSDYLLLNRNEKAMYAKYMKNDWQIDSKKFAPNTSFQYSMGHTFKRKEKDFIGMILALTYNKNNSYNETERNSFQNSTSEDMPSQQEASYLDKVYASQTLAGALANFSAKINENHIISFKNLYSINSDDRVIRKTGTPNIQEPNKTLIRSTAQWFTSNKIYTGQLGGDHYIPKAKIKVNWLGAYSNIERQIPNLRRNIFSRFETFNNPGEPNPKDTTYFANVSSTSVGASYGGGRFYSTNKESIYSFKTDVNYSFTFKDHFKNDIKIGGSYQNRSREFSARQLGYIKYSSTKFVDSLLYLDENTVFAEQNLGNYQNNSNFNTGKGGYILQDGTKPTDSYNAKSTLTAGYLMFDNRYKDLLRIIWGARVENFHQELNAVRDNKQPLKIDTTVLDILPSVNLIYSLTSKQNLRFCFSKTLNRPEFRELAPFAFYDFNTQFVVSGNDTLKRASILNYDLRYEFYPGRGQIFSATGFYKDFTNPIEQVMLGSSTDQVFYNNVPKAKAYGAELEFRVVLGAIFKADSSRFLNNLTLYSNFAYIKSTVDVSNVIGSSVKERSLQGQSPYIFNAGLLYNDSDLGYSVSATVNRVGQRIAIVGNVQEPDLWENGRTAIDIQLGKTLLKNKFELKFNIRDVLAQKQYFFQDVNGNKKFDKNTDDQIWITKYGRTFSLTIGYKF